MSVVEAHGTAAPSVLRGQVRGLTRRRETANFFFAPSDQAAMGGIAIAAAAAGAGAQAVSTAMAASDMEETADYLSFWIDDRRCKGWVWRSPIQEGDVVEVVGSPNAEHFELYAVARPRDRKIALYPHMSRGSKTQWANALKLWLVGSLATIVPMYVLATAITIFSSGVDEVLSLGYHALLFGSSLIAVAFF
jgi:hypothetical protein